MHWKWQIWGISQELIFWPPHSSLKGERKIRRHLFTSSIKRAVRRFHVAVVQWRQKKNVQKQRDTCKVVVLLVKPIARFHSLDQHLCKFIGIKESQPTWPPWCHVKTLYWLPSPSSLLSALKFEVLWRIYWDGENRTVAWISLIQRL